MAKKDYSQEIRTLEAFLAKYPFDAKKLGQYEIKLISETFSLYRAYCQSFLGYEVDPTVKDINSFIEKVKSSEIDTIQKKLINLNSLEEEEPRKQRPPTKENSTIPQDLEGLVAQYKENQTDKILSSDKPNSVEAAVKRARQTWETRHRIQLIQKNREDYQKKSDDFFAENVDPKIGDRKESFKQTTEVLTRVIEVQAESLDLKLNSKEIQQAVDDIAYLATAGAVDIDNLYELNIASQLALRNLESQSFDSPLNKIDVENTYTDDPKIDEEAAENYYQDSTKVLSRKLHENPLDNFDDKLRDAKKSLSNLQFNLASAIPNAKLPETPLQTQGATLEATLRQADPSLRINPTGLGARASATLETVKSQERNLSPEVIALYSSGLTPEKFQKAENFAKANPNSPLGELYKKQPDVFDQVHFQLNKIHSSKLGQEIAAKPLSGLSGGLTNTFNKLPPGVQGAARLALNPTGTVSNWVNRQIGKNIGNQLIKITGSNLSQKLGGFLIKEGFTGGVKAFTSESAKKLAIKAASWAATKLGVSLAAESVNGIAPGLGILLDIAAQIALWLGEKTVGAVYSAFQKLAKSIYGEEVDAKDLAALGAILAGTAVAAGVTVIGGIQIVGVATKSALISAAGIIALTLIVIGLYLGMIFLVAPILSTLVQLDSVEKVDYSQYITTASTGDCVWPTSGHYVIVTGPNGGTHYRSKLEAIDIAAPGGSPLLSSTTGIVAFTGVYSNYGNTVKIQTQNSAGSFLAVYGHLSDIGVTVGQQISQGKQIGLVGGSGGWSPHIHMEWQGIKYNQCPAGGLIIKEGCCIPYPGGTCTGLCNAYSN